MTYSFLNDYSDGGHTAILTAIAEDNLKQQSGYGADDISEQARELLRERTRQPDAAIHFVTGGTQANVLCLAAMLKPFEAVIAPATGHIAANEAGAIEATGHKVITMPSSDGKLTPDEVLRALNQFSLHPHMVRARVVYISNATEMGTVYTKAELTALSMCCRENDLRLFMDGARLGVALASQYNDVSLADVAALTDMFWLGGTKMGAMLGEAIVITHDTVKEDFGFHLKQRGAMLAKGRILGTQFRELLRDDLYLELSKHANRMAEKLANGLSKAGFELLAPVESNQIFTVLPRACIDRLSTSFAFYEWEIRPNGDGVVRLVTSWATDEAHVDAFVRDIAH